jgi:hypothetical protein
MSQIGSKSSESAEVEKKSLWTVAKEVWSGLWSGVKEWFPLVLVGVAMLFLLVYFLLSWV